MRGAIVAASPPPPARCWTAARQQSSRQQQRLRRGAPPDLHRRRRHRSTIAAAAAAANDAPADLFAAAADARLASFDQMQQAMRQLDRDMDFLFWGPGGRSPFAEAERELEGALRRADEAAANARREAATTTTTSRNDGRVRVERSETRSPGAYRYYERIEINGGSAWAPPPTPAPSGGGLPLLVALVCAGAYAALTSAFARNFDLTLYAARDKVRLALTWPLLLATSPSFRAQFVSAVVKGERVRVTPGVTVDVGGGAGPDDGGKQERQRQHGQGT
jgi:hypothetical protein